MVADSKLKRWIKTVNEEYGLSDKNETTFAYFKKIEPYCKFVLNDDFYIVYNIYQDMWDNRCLGVISWYIRKGKRTIGNFRTIQEIIERVAKAEKVRYIYQGSHLNNKFNDLLKKLGYDNSVLRKEL